MGVSEGRVVYLIGNLDDVTLPVKIGSTLQKNLYKRLSAIQTSCPFKVDVLHSFTGSYSVEKHFHRIFKLKQVHGEWFNLDEDDFKLFLDDYYQRAVRKKHDYPTPLNNIKNCWCWGCWDD